ncbi:hypothetical protein ACFXO7_09615 [Nocardia tengchongensis]
MAEHLFERVGQGGERTGTADEGVRCASPVVGDQDRILVRKRDE